MEPVEGQTDRPNGWVRLDQDMQEKLWALTDRRDDKKSLNNCGSRNRPAGDILSRWGEISYIEKFRHFLIYCTRHPILSGFEV